MQQKQKMLIAEFNEIRKMQKPINEFRNVAEWLQHGKTIATKKAEILKQLETIS